MFAVALGAWLIYVAVVELLAILAPIQAGSSGKARRRFAPMRLAAAGAVIAGVLAIVLVLGGEKRSEARPPGAPEACNGYPELCEKRIDQVTFPGPTTRCRRWPSRGGSSPTSATGSSASSTTGSAAC